MDKLVAGVVFGGDFRVVSPLSEGGMGAVYVVEQLSTSKRRALKLMRTDLVTDDGMRQRFVQEARIGAKIASDHVVEVVAAGVDDRTPYLVMELLEGETLSDHVRLHGALSPAEALPIMQQICHAVGAAHDAGVVHRDLKPENIFLARSQRADSAWTIKVLDFGIAKLLAEGVTNDTAAMGSPIWLAPEQTERAAVVPATDVWSLALIVFHLLTGRYFWRALDGEPAKVARLLREVVLDPIPTATARATELGAVLPAGFDDWFARCLTRDPSARFADARLAFAALRPILAAAGGTRAVQSATSSPLSFASAPTEAGPARVADTPLALAATEANATPVDRPRALARVAAAVVLAAGFVWVFASGYGEVRGLMIERLGGFQTPITTFLFLVAAALLLVRRKPVRWLALVTCFAGTLGAHAGSQSTLAGMARVPLSGRFPLLCEGLYESNVNRFVSFGLAAALVAAGLLFLPRPRSREQGVRFAAVAAFAYACLALSLITRAEALAGAAWEEHSRSERAAMIVASAKSCLYTEAALVVAALALLGLAFWWVRRLQGGIALRGVVAGQSAVVVVVLAGIVVDGAMSWRFRLWSREVYDEIAPEFELFAQLDPPTCAKNLPKPPSAPTLKLSRDRVAVDAKPVGLVSALDQGNLDAVLLADLSHRLAEASATTDPPLLVLADRTISSRTLANALRIALRAGATHVGILWTRGPAPVFHPDDPSEAAYAVAKDFGMIRVTVEPCPVVAFDWPSLTPDAIVCVGPT
jgi:tRNA A-37 threonylcarbamoyl transferase component Bud32